MRSENLSFRFFFKHQFLAIWAWVDTRDTENIIFKEKRGLHVHIRCPCIFVCFEG